ncbi:Subtilisin-like protease [Morus notabilis]|uniref:Subtilisin-like protease n=2 Tax=Morus notabilis TaxID=981085 RepID=W9RT70_9ROSA|nr:Subtilisin-like protease [Morus notabilis]
MLQLHTTRSWDFMGLSLSNSDEATPLQLAYGDNIIVGLIDSGIWPESESFQEEPGMKPIPSTWKGKCVKGEMFNPEKACNKKLIGARYYVEGFERSYGLLNKSGNPEYRSPRDFLGHGTHTASTAVGSIANDASFLGLGQGTARGGAPRARLAVYKACWGKDYMGQCSEADILAAFDDALHDGVHVISASIGSTPPLPELFASSNAIGSFHAMQLGISVVFAAGNDGPDPGLVSNVEPWGISVAASSVDRKFPTNIIVESNFSIMGESFITSPVTAKLVDPITYFTNGICNLNYRKNSKTATGRVMLCFSSVGPVEAGDAQAAAFGVNASALIFVQAVTKLTGPDPFRPTVYVDIDQGTKIKHYLALFQRLPTVQIAPAKTIIGKSLAPRVASFSSRGPSSLAPDILKPDISAPGVNILAAWPTKTPPTVVPSDFYKQPVSWNIISGTSMSCPHVSGIVALLKSAHPNWSPAAIKSALMTTAYTRDSSLDYILNGDSKKVSDPFDIGAGHVEPLKAMDPGLVYDMKTVDYILFLCNLGYSQKQIKALVLSSPEIDTSCSRVMKSNANVNYPSITVSDLQSATTIKRTVRNVSPSKFSVYFSSIVKPDGVEVVVWPRVLVFSWSKEEITYYVTLIPKKNSQDRYDFGEVVWSDGFGHKVRSPLVVCVNTIAGTDYNYGPTSTRTITSAT